MEKRYVKNVIEGKKRLCITGGWGSIGTQVIDHLVKNTNWDIVVLDSFRHKGYPDRMDLVDLTRVKTIQHDLVCPINPEMIKEIGKVDYILHLAAMSDVFFSVENPVYTIYNNIASTLMMLEYARKAKPKAFVYFGCYDKKTRAVTKNGFKYYHELKKGDVVFTLNEDKEIEEQPIDKILTFDYDGEMIKLSNGLMNMMVTPNHRMYNNKMEIFEADNLLSLVGYKSYKLPYPSNFTGKNEEILIGGNKIDLNDLFYLSGVFIGDGFTAYQERLTKNKSGLSKEEFNKRKDLKGRFISGRTGNKETIISKSWRIFFDVPENDKARKRLEKTLKKLGINYTCNKGKSGEHIYFTSKIWSEYFEQFGKYAKNKTIPEWMLGYDKKYLQSLFDGLIDSDGYRHKLGYQDYSTVSKTLSEKICELGLKIGLYPKLYKTYNESEIDGRKISGSAYNIVFGSNLKSIKASRITTEKYKDKVWCITVKNKNFLTEREGCFAFSGNTDESYGPVKKGEAHKEWDTHRPSNAYSASKAACEDICYSYWRSYDVPLILTNTMNNFSFAQSSTKFPVIIQKKVEAGEVVTIHGNKKEIGTRFYIDSRRVAKVLLDILKIGAYKHKIGELDEPLRYHIVGKYCLSNLELAKLIAKLMGKPLKYKLVDFHKENKAHDIHYGLENNKIEIEDDLEKDLKEVIEWQNLHKEWMAK